MIEDNIQVLRQAAKVSSEESSEKMWCVIAGNDKLIDDIAYEAIASKDKVKILFREHVILKEKRVHKKFDFIMIHGVTSSIREFKDISKEKGGAFIQISPYYLEEEPNLMLLVGPDDVIRKFVSNVEQAKAPFAILLGDQTTGFIETDLQTGIKLPSFLKSILTPLFNMSDVVLSTVLISVDHNKDIKKIQEIATSNKIFVIDFKDIIMED